MKFNVFFDKRTRVWVAYLVDEMGQIGDAEYAPTKGEAIYAIGFAYGRYPEKFSRTLSDEYVLYMHESGSVVNA